MAPLQPSVSSPLYIERVSQYVPLPPTSLNAPLPAICTEVFSPLLLNYYAPVQGVVLAYEDVKLSSKPPQTQAPSSQKSHKSSRKQEPATAETPEEGGAVLLNCIDEYMAPHVWATASLLVWRPAPNSYLSATLTHQSATHVTLAHLNTFAISILKEHLPRDWMWYSAEANRKTKGWDGKISDEGGWWVDGDEKKVEKGREFQVRVKEWDVRGGKGRGHLKIDGSLLSVEEEKSKAEKAKGKTATNGEVMEID